MQKSNHITGKTKDGSFQIGVRKTFNIDHKRAWQIITSEAGIRLWLGEHDDTPMEVDQPFTLKDGTDVHFSVIKPDSHLRLKWQPPQWKKASTIQIRTIQNGKKNRCFLSSGKYAG